MVVTTLEAQVAPDQWQTLEQAFRNAIRELDRGIVETFLLHNSREPDAW